MMTNEQKILAAAKLLVRQHGLLAPAIAREEALECLNKGDNLRSIVWCWIADSTAALLGLVPEGGQRVHQTETGAASKDDRPLAILYSALTT